MSRLGMGTASLHHLWSSRERQALLLTAFDLGMTHFDTAPLYGDGLAEDEVGRFLQGRRDRCTVATKFGLPARSWVRRFPALVYAAKAATIVRRRLLSLGTNERHRDLSLASVRSSVEASLRALRTHHIDVLLLHEPDLADVPHIERLEGWLSSIKRAGQVRHLGLAGQADSCLDVASRWPDLFDVLQVEDSLEARQADAVIASGRPMQITYGYLRQARTGQTDAATVLEAALRRNDGGTVLVSSRAPERLRVLAHAAARRDAS